VVVDARVVDFEDAAEAVHGFHHLRGAHFVLLGDEGQVADFLAGLPASATRSSTVWLRASWRSASRARRSSCCSRAAANLSGSRGVVLK
jgi:hypothetical protein